MGTRRALAAILGGALAVLAACSSLQITADYDRQADFSRYHTFAFKSVQDLQNDILTRRIESALAEGLTARGLIRDDANPDLWVVSHVRLSHETVIYTWDTGWGYGWRWHGPGVAASTVDQIPIGTLILDLVDTRTHELVWRGTATGTLDPQASADERDRRLRNAVAEMLKAYPPALH
jgi:hypothetical protein